MTARPALFVGLAALFAGCGPSCPALVPAGGTVSLKGGRPLTAGVVEFAPTNGGPAARARIGPDGRFTLTTAGRPGAVPGAHRVVVVAGATDGAPMSHASKHKIPAPARKYAQFETSGLERTVDAAGPNDFALDLDAE